jgi:hypothetical protein
MAHLFGQETGFVCIAFILAGKKDFKEEFHHWPEDRDKIDERINLFEQTHNVYFCPQLLSRPKRIKDNVAICTCAWSDLDECHPSNCVVRPTATVETSPNRYQAYWAFEEPLDPYDAESLSKRIAYYHAFQGADTSGWDLTQLMRVPATHNRKPDYDDVTVRLLDHRPDKYRKEDFAKYPILAETTEEENELPGDLPDFTGEELLTKYDHELAPQVYLHWANVPDKGQDWSKVLWNLNMFCFEAGLTKQEVFIIADSSACNKFKRDRPHDYQKSLWKDVCKAWVRYQENLKLVAPPEQFMRPLLLDRERESLEGFSTFVEDYIAWASSLGDAAPQYHQAGAFIILSALLSGSVQLPTSFGTMKPNLWFMILADTTLTRKSTAMDIAMDLLEEVDSSTILATDGSIEGLMSSLSTRPSQPSIFLRDEFSGLLDSMVKKDYYAGMAETLTKLYDGKLQKRILKKEVIEVKDPCLMLFAGGIKNKVCSLLTTEHISSGFIPRFVFITAESDVTRVQPLGPPTERDTTGREAILNTMRQLRDHYYTEPKLIRQGSRMVYAPPVKWDAQLTPEAWARFNALESDMMKAGLKAEAPEIVTPTYDRLCKSGLKAAVLSAASRNPVEPGQTVVVELIDMLYGIRFVEQWRDYTNQIINSIGLTTNERELEKVLGAIRREPGITRSRLMQAYHLTSTSAGHVFETLKQRGLVTMNKAGSGKAERYFPIEKKKKVVKL